MRPFLNERRTFAVADSYAAARRRARTYQFRGPRGGRSASRGADRAAGRQKMAQRKRLNLALTGGARAVPLLSTVGSVDQLSATTCRKRSQVSLLLLSQRSRSPFPGARVSRNERPCRPPPAVVPRPSFRGWLAGAPRCRTVVTGPAFFAGRRPPRPPRSFRACANPGSRSLSPARSAFGTP